MASLRSVCGPALSFALIAALANAALAQPAIESPAALQQWREVVNAQLAAIAEEQTHSGPFSETLVDPLMRLGLTQQEYGEHDLALESLARAQQITRVNQGLYTLEQVPMLRRMMASETASGNVQQAVEIENQLLDLARRNPSDSRGVSIFRDAADRQMAEYERYLAGDAPPVPVYSFTVGATVTGGWSSSRASYLSNLWQARRNYRTAIGIMSRSGTATREKLIDLERTLLDTYYLEVTASDNMNELSPFLYGQALRSLVRLLSYSNAGAATAVDVAKVLVEIADWDLLFSRNGVAVDRYAQAYRLLLTARVPTDTIREIFPTGTPVLLPSFVRKPPLAVVDESAAGYVDVAFDLTKYGKSRKEEVVGATGDGVEHFANDAKLFVARSRFRPSPPGVEAEHAEPYRLRYYVTR